MRRATDEPDCYAVLGVAPDATVAEILRAFRRQALVHHPDRGGDAHAFRLLCRARQVLLDPGRRTAHDRRRAAEPAPGRSGQPPGPEQDAAGPFEWAQGAGPGSEERSYRSAGRRAYHAPFSAYQAGYSWRRSDRFAWWRGPTR
ncbi:J domain-containing protein [Micromonospora sp. LOL_024]|uniref:J domain-containing protein n=1 Tax=Micromonospora sp. LOL_024 TaxID=3345412 RepID=UPI003A876AAA